ncbi:hypothetical protein LINPERHAP2_LOCUS9977 [Linum perenne]
MFFNASHSAMKLLEAPRRCKLNTFTAMLMLASPISSRTPLYTEPKLPTPI